MKGENCINYAKIVIYYAEAGISSLKKFCTLYISMDIVY